MKKRLLFMLFFLATITTFVSSFVEKPHSCFTDLKSCGCMYGGDDVPCFGDDNCGKILPCD